MEMTKSHDRKAPFPTCFVIAEAGVNHNGNLDLAKRLVDAAVDAGADAVKFQAFRAEELAVSDAPKAEYQVETTGSGESQLAMLQRLELTAEALAVLAGYCDKKGILFLATPFDGTSVDLLDSLGMAYFKIASGEITNFPLLRHIASKGKRVILSTGMSTLEEVREALEEMAKSGCKDVIILHCVTEYPAPPEEVNLFAMVTMRNKFKYPVGYSDHTLGIEVALASVALGACVIEKHLTLSRDMVGPDHRASLEPAEFKQMVAKIRMVEAALGNGVKVPASCEASNRVIARRSLVAAVAIPAGTILRENMIACKRPGNGISAKFYDDVVGRRVRKNIQAGEVIDREAFNDC